MILSIIIPTFNRKKLLEKTLMYICNQKNVNMHEVEIIVVDDGSNDNSDEVVNKYKAENANIKYVYIPRQAAESNRSKVRNIGISQAVGKYITFIDCGVVIPERFVENVLNIYDELKEAAAIFHYTLGVNVDVNSEEAKVINELSTQNFSSIVKQLEKSYEWADTREELFDSVNGKLSRLPAPWTLGWSLVITVPKKYVDYINGFDESFVGWGSEDIDFCYRLYKKGVQFISESTKKSIHIPHIISNSSGKEISNIKNREKLHKKFWNLETELYVIYTGRYYNYVLAKLNNLIISNVIPRYETSFLINLKDKYIKNNQKTLLIGNDRKYMPEILGVNNVFVHNKLTYDKFKKMYKSLEVNYILGINTKYEDNYFDVAVVTDFYRMFSEKVLSKFIKESKRICKEVYLIYDAKFISPVKKFDNNRWLNINEIKEAVEKCGFKLIQKCYKDYFILCIC